MIARYMVVIGMALSFHTMACDVCGAVNSALGLGTVAAGNRHTIGFTYQYRNYHSNHPPLFNEPGVSSSEQFQRLDLSGTIRLAPNWQLRAVLPYTYGYQQKENGGGHKQGFGDPTISGHYFLFNRNRADSIHSSTFRWSLGAGIKMPLGKFPHPDDELLLLYPGTGTWDVTFQSSLFYRRNKWAIIQEMNTVLRTTNRYKYTPGSLFSATLYTMRRFSNWSLFGGFQYAWNGSDYQDRMLINSSPSQGNILSATLGASIQWGNLMVQANYHVPVIQDLGNGYVTQQHSLTAGVYYVFN